ncbi:MAG: MBL fold metallo-hydrolase [Bacteroidales bacterium]|nr:MBL fold metallo-hydrolase [Bacteroidales bacterium]
MKTWVTSGGYEITRILFGRSNVFSVAGRSLRLLVDTGWSGDGTRLLKRLDRTGKPDAVIMTHTHFDHAGNAARIKERFSAVFIVHETEKEFLESGDSPIPHGTIAWSRLLYNLGAEHVPQWFHVSGVNADIVFRERYDLSSFGFNAYILHTPGHSAGSSSVVVENEIAIAGDLLAGMPVSIYPAWGDDPPAIVRSWKKLLDTGCHIFLPAHGLPVSRLRFEREYTKLVNLSDGFQRKTLL